MLDEINQHILSSKQLKTSSEDQAHPFDMAKAQQVMKGMDKRQQSLVE